MRRLPLLAALLGLAPAAFAQADAAPKKKKANKSKAYHVTVKGADDASAVEKALGSLKFVASVEAKGKGVFAVTTKKRKKGKRLMYLSESAVRAAVGKMGGKVASVELPRWAKVQVWICEASGGG